MLLYLWMYNLRRRYTFDFVCCLKVNFLLGYVWQNQENSRQQSFLKSWLHQVSHYRTNTELSYGCKLCLNLQGSKKRIFKKNPELNWTELKRNCNACASWWAHWGERIAVSVSRWAHSGSASECISPVDALCTGSVEESGCLL
jgi:hypothetical protein